MEYKCEQDTPAWKLFHTEFLVSIPAAHVRSVHDQKVFGFVSTGDSEYDKQLAHAHTKVYRKIPELAELLDAGVNPNILNPDDQIPRMTELIKAHIQEIDNLQSGRYSRVRPEDELDPEVLEELQLLEKFSAWMNKVPLDEKPIDNSPKGYAAYLQRFQLMSMGGLEGAPPSVPIKPFTNADSGFTKKGLRRIPRW